MAIPNTSFTGSVSVLEIYPLQNIDTGISHLLAPQELTEWLARTPKLHSVGEDTIFMNKTTYYAKSIATAPGARYHCVSMPTSLGKNAKQIMRGRQNGVTKEHVKYSEFMQQSGMKQILDDIAHGKLIKQTKFELCKIPIVTMKYYSNDSMKFCMLGIPLFTRRKTHNRIQIFICGIYLFRRYTRAA